jgi:hypothetical protein
LDTLALPWVPTDYNQTIPIRLVYGFISKVKN